MHYEFSVRTPKLIQFVKRTSVLPGIGLASVACAGEIEEPLDATPPLVPSSQEQQAIDDAQRAIDAELSATDPELFEVALRYFPGEDFQGAPKRVFRLTRTQLDTTTQSLLPGHVVQSALTALPRDPLQTNYEYSAHLGFNSANFTPWTAWVSSIADSVTQAPESVLDCTSEGDSNDCLQRQAQRFASRAFRNVVTEADLNRFSDLLLSSWTQVGPAQAIADLVSVTLTSPRYVFREEVLTDADGYLLDAQRLQNISYTLADAPPEVLGLNVGQLANTEDLVAQVLSTPQARAKLLRFFIAWLEAREPDEFTIAESVFPEFTPEVAQGVVEEVGAFLRQQLDKAAPTLKDVTESQQSFISDAIDFIYGVQAPSGTEPTTLDGAQRLGIFTLPGVIASHSGPTTTRLVKRGVFFTRKVMCLPLGVPPADVDTTVPTTEGQTERQRIEAVTQPARCAGCHNYINPFGFMQENYDAIGRWRTTDEGLPVDASISIDFLDEGPLQTSTPIDALRGLTQSLRFQQCFARQLFRFYMGRDESEYDHPTLRQMFFQFAHNGDQDIVGLLRVLSTSANFSRRSEVL